MKKVFQTNKTKNEGNCMRAAIASLLELKLNDVPNFILMLGDWIENITNYLKGEGFDVLGMLYNKKYLIWYDKLNKEYQHDINELKNHNGINGYFFAGVLSPSYFKDKKQLSSHAVIIDSYFNIIYDPNMNVEKYPLSDEFGYNGIIDVLIVNQ